MGLREFPPYFQEQAVDVAIIDTPWNGVWQSMKIASAAEAFEVKLAPHNFYGHLCSMMNAHFCAAVAEPANHGNRHRPSGVGPRAIHTRAGDPERPAHHSRSARGTEPNEEALRAHPPRTTGGLLNYGRKG